MVQLNSELNNSNSSANSHNNNSHFYHNTSHQHYNNLMLLSTDAMLRPENASNRSHSICVLPSSTTSSPSSSDFSFSNKDFKDCTVAVAASDSTPPLDPPGSGGSKGVVALADHHHHHQHHDKNNNLKQVDQVEANSATTHPAAAAEDINLTNRQILKDKTEGLAHLDLQSIQAQQHLHHHHEEASSLFRGSHLNVQLPPITNSPTSILRDTGIGGNGGGGQHGSYYELKHMQAGRYTNGGGGGDPGRYQNGSGVDLGKKIIFETGPPPTKTLVQDPNLDPVDGIVALLSAIYCKIVVVIGLCFPMAEVISHRIPISWYEGFYLYLYTGSIVFLIFVYIFLLNRKRKPAFSRLRSCAMRTCRLFYWGKSGQKGSGETGRGRGGDHESSSSDDDDEADEEKPEPRQQIQCGSFYLRVGAVAFGVGSMIYSGLEFGQFFELESKEHCYSFMYGLTPGSHMIFTFIQLYFIFMNSRVVFSRHKLIARFGLMHMIGTNICVWLHVLIQETKHQIMTMVETNSTEMGNVDMTQAWDHLDDVVEELSEDYLDSVSSHPLVPHRNIIPPGGHHAVIAQLTPNLTSLFTSTTSTVPPIGPNLAVLHREIRSLNDHYITHSDCRRSNIIGELVTDASQFLFPCTIEYSLICAAILYIMWKSISEMRHKPVSHINQMCKQTTTLVHQRHHYQVDCAKAHKGLFTGIFLMVICIISLILFFVFIKKDQYRNLAVLQAHIVELVIYCINAIACLIALFQVRELNYNRSRGVELDNILLIIAQSGLCIFTMFSVIGAQFISQLQNTRLVLINAFACLIQSTLQSVFILDASKRKASTADQVRRKPGREMVTFLLVCNFSMWAINTLETRRAESNPVQMSFYGFWAWTIITHVTMPLTIFYRFHSTVCLCEIWKGTYKIKSEYL